MEDTMRIPFTRDEWETIKKASGSVKVSNNFTRNEWIDLVYTLYRYSIDHPEEMDDIKKVHRRDLSTSLKRFVLDYKQRTIGLSYLQISVLCQHIGRI